MTTIQENEFGISSSILDEALYVFFLLMPLWKAWTYFFLPHNPNK